MRLRAQTKASAKAPAKTGATLLLESPSGFEPRALTANATIGRDSRCDVFIDHPTVSRLHARLWQDEGGWHFQDLGSQNGSRVDATYLSEQASITDGTALHIGRVRAWFFSGTVPDAWLPNHDPELAGKLVRCRCKQISWVPDHAAGMTLKCPRCFRDIVIRDRELPAVPAPTLAPAAELVIDAGHAANHPECAACHTPIAPGEATIACPDCAAQMHDGCWRENLGCATYGCAQVGALARTGDPSSVDSAHAGATHLDEVSEPDLLPEFVAAERSNGIPLHAAQLLLVSLAGLPTFGAPAIAYGAYRALANGPWPPRVGYAGVSLVAGVAGFLASSYWWLGGAR